MEGSTGRLLPWLLAEVYNFFGQQNIIYFFSW